MAKFRLGRTVLEFPAPPNLEEALDRWVAECHAVGELERRATLRRFRSRMELGTHPYLMWNINVSVAANCRIEGWAEREHVGWLEAFSMQRWFWLFAPKEILLDSDERTCSGYSGAADEGRKQLNRLLAMLGQPSIPTHRET